MTNSMNKLNQKALGVLERLEDELHPDQSELRDAICNAIIMEFEDWYDIIREKESAELERWFD
jgi:hypothetical protein